MRKRQTRLWMRRKDVWDARHANLYGNQHRPCQTDAKPPLFRLLRITNPHFTSVSLWRCTDHVWACIQAEAKISWMQGMSPQQVEVHLLRLKADWSWTPMHPTPKSTGDALGAFSLLTQENAAQYKNPTDTLNRQEPTPPDGERGAVPAKAGCNAESARLLCGSLREPVGSSTGESQARVDHQPPGHSSSFRLHCETPRQPVSSRYDSLPRTAVTY